VGINSESNKNNALHNPKQLIMKEKIKKEKIFPRPANQQGSILAFSLIIMFILMIIAIGVATVSVQERKMSSDTGKSTLAFQVADSGMEVALENIIGNSYITVDQITNPSLGNMSCDDSSGLAIITGSMPSGNYELTFENTSGLISECDNEDNITIIKSSGSYAGTKRAVEVDL